MKYSERIAKSKDQKDQANLTVQAAEADLNLQKAILDAGVRVKRAENALEASKESTPLDIAAVVLNKRSLVAAQEDLTDLSAIRSELF
jgi:hypothetical protein